MDKDTAQAYQSLLGQALKHRSASSRNLGALLLNSFNSGIAGTGFLAGDFRHLDSENQLAVLRYLKWLGSAPGLYPPSEDMNELKGEWVARGWLSVPQEALQDD
jgi:hypothetical protein